MTQDKDEIGTFFNISIKPIFSIRIDNDVGLSPDNTLITLLRLQSPGLTSPPPPAQLSEPPLLAHGADWFMLAFGFGTFAYATVSSRRQYMSDKDQASISGACVTPSTSQAVRASPSRSLCELNEMPASRRFAKDNPTLLSMTYLGYTNGGK